MKRGALTARCPGQPQRPSPHWPSTLSPRAQRSTCRRKRGGRDTQKGLAVGNPVPREGGSQRQSGMDATQPGTQKGTRAAAAASALLNHPSRGTTRRRQPAHNYSPVGKPHGDAQAQQLKHAVDQGQAVDAARGRGSTGRAHQLSAYAALPGSGVRGQVPRPPSQQRSRWQLTQNPA